MFWRIKKLLGMLPEIREGDVWVEIEAPVFQSLSYVKIIGYDRGYVRYRTIKDVSCIVPSQTIPERVFRKEYNPIEWIENDEKNVDEMIAKDWSEDQDIFETDMPRFP